jgi:hypothetical protein
VLIVNGKQVTHHDSSYITDVLTDHALDWLKNREQDQPFFLYLSSKAVHTEFMPAKFTEATMVFHLANTA